MSICLLFLNKTRSEYYWDWMPEKAIWNGKINNRKRFFCFCFSLSLRSNMERYYYAKCKRKSTEHKGYKDGKNTLFQRKMLKLPKVRSCGKRIVTNAVGFQFVFWENWNAASWNFGKIIFISAIFVTEVFFRS